MEKILFISELHHLFLSLTIFAFLFWRYRDWRLLITCLLFGFLIDLDHLLDYFFYFGFTFNLGDFLRVDRYMIPSGKIYVLLHGWEYSFIFWFLGKKLEKNLKINGLTWAVILSYLGHMLIDNFYYAHHPFAYSIIFRLINSFSLHAISKT